MKTSDLLSVYVGMDIVFKSLEKVDDDSAGITLFRLDVKLLNELLEDIVKKYADPAKEKLN